MADITKFAELVHRDHGLAVMPSSSRTHRP
jgi:hypothetical protein